MRPECEINRIGAPKRRPGAPQLTCAIKNGAFQASQSLFTLRQNLTPPRQTEHAAHGVLIPGGTVTVGTDQSDVQGGRVARTKVPCDPGNLASTGDKPDQFGGRVFRNAAEGTSAVEAQLTLYGRSPLSSEFTSPGLFELEDATASPVILDYRPASVATSFQLGSREDRSRANIHTSVTSVTFSGFPSITLLALSRVTEMS